jgi:PmbA protein
MNMGDLLPTADFGVKKGLELGADEVEMILMEAENSEVVLENNDIHIGRTDIRSGAGVRIFKDKGLGFASINTTDEKDIVNAVERALQLAAHAPPEPWNELPDKVPLKKIEGLYDPEIEGYETADILEMSSEMLGAAKERDQRITVESGVFSVGKGYGAIANSRGIEAEERTSIFVYYLVGMAVDGQEVSNLDYSVDFTYEAKRIDVLKVANEFAERVISSLGAKSVKSFEGPAILGPDTGRLLLGTVVGNAIDSDSVQKGMSKFANKRGEHVANSHLTITDDGLLEGGLATSSFDREGLPHRQIKLIEKGELKSFIYNTKTAKKEDTESTGNASGSERHPPGIGSTNFVVDSGGTDYEDMVSGIDHGIIVRRLSGYPEVISGDFSAVVKGGFLIEKGEIVQPVTDAMVSGNVFDIIENIDAVSKERETILNYIFPHIEVGKVFVTGK